MRRAIGISPPSVKFFGRIAGGVKEIWDDVCPLLTGKNSSFQTMDGEGVPEVMYAGAGFGMGYAGEHQVVAEPNIRRAIVEFSPLGTGQKAGSVSVEHVQG